MEYLDILFYMACKQSPVGHARIAAALVDRHGELLAYGQNKYKTHPLQARFSKNRSSIYLHAEIDSIANAIRSAGIDRLKGGKVYVSRARYVRNVWTKGCASPCSGCREALKHFGIRWVST